MEEVAMKETENFLEFGSWTLDTHYENYKLNDSQVKFYFKIEGYTVRITVASFMDDEKSFGLIEVQNPESDEWYKIYRLQNTEMKTEKLKDLKFGRRPNGLHFFLQDIQFLSKKAVDIVL